MESNVTCPSCGALLASRGDSCPQCGETLTLRRSKPKAPSQALLDLNKFLLVAMVFVVAVVTLGFLLF